MTLGAHIFPPEKQEWNIGDTMPGEAYMDFMWRVGKLLMPVQQMERAVGKSTFYNGTTRGLIMGMGTGGEGGDTDEQFKIIRLKKMIEGSIVEATTIKEARKIGRPKLADGEKGTKKRKKVESASAAPKKAKQQKTNVGWPRRETRSATQQQLSYSGVCASSSSSSDGGGVLAQQQEAQGDSDGDFFAQQRQQLGVPDGDFFSQPQSQSQGAQGVPSSEFFSQPQSQPSQLEDATEPNGVLVYQGICTIKSVSDKHSGVGELEDDMIPVDDEDDDDDGECASKSNLGSVGGKSKAGGLDGGEVQAVMGLVRLRLVWDAERL